MVAYPDLGALLSLTQTGGGGGSNTSLGYSVFGLSLVAIFPPMSTKEMTSWGGWMTGKMRVSKCKKEIKQTGTRWRG